MKAFFTHPITIAVGIIITLGILAIVGYNYWGWFGGKSNGMTGWPPPDFDCDTTIEQGGHTYKLSKVSPSKSNDGTYVAMFVVTEIVPQGIQNTISRGLSKSQYNKLLAKCPELIPATTSGNYQEDESTTRTSFASGGKVSEPSAERKAVNTIPKQKSMDWHGQGGWIDGNKTLTFIGYKPSIFSIGETVNVDFRLTPTSPIVKTITAKVIAIPSPNKSFIVIDSPHETIYNQAYGRVYN